MTELKDIAKEYDVDLENCVVFIRGNDDILAVDITNAGIRQRSDDTMGFTFSLPPKETLKLEEYHPKFNITLFAQKAIVEPEDSYFAPTCACCEFCHIG